MPASPHACRTGRRRCEAKKTDESAKRAPIITIIISSRTRRPSWMAYAMARVHSDGRGSAPPPRASSTSRSCHSCGVHSNEMMRRDEEEHDDDRQRVGCGGTR
ncbi:hypothetical protein ACCO45_004780 [Purpureocillium lilacinum]|uniref:Uncharacterized protein n=1 Tax=Purpureocillium lilacinum TaxID=33203 RepID=A0ACC4DWI1_PURLI